MLSYVLPAVTILAAVVAGFILVRSRQVTTTTTLQDQAIASLEAVVTAQATQIAMVEKDNELCKTKAEAQDKVIDQQTHRINDLERIVTARDLIERGFRHLGVPAEVLNGPSSTR